MSDALFRVLGQAGLEYQKKVERDKAQAKQIYDDLFPAQRQMLDDPHEYKAAICPRRSGKSFLGAAACLIKGLLKPGARCIIIGLTQDSAKRSFWRAIEDVVRKYGLEVEFNKNDLAWRHWNGSYGRLFGAETLDRIERIRGDEFDLAIVDEAKSFSPSSLDYLVHEVLDPAVGTRDGQLWMVGTPGHVFAGEFYLATNPGTKRRVDGRETEQVVARWFAPDNGVMTDVLWSTHRWTMADNTKVGMTVLNGARVSVQWARALRKKQRMNWRDDHPTWRREYLGEWVVNEDGLVYAFSSLLYTDPDRVAWRPDPNRPGSHGLPDGEWSYLLGVDFGFENPTAFVVAAFTQSPPRLLFLHSEKHQHLVLSDVAEVYKRLVRTYGGFDAVVADCGAQGKMIHQTLQTDYGVPAIPAEKTNKMAYIQAFNSDLHGARIKLVVGSPLADEMTTLAWDLTNGAKAELGRKGTLREDPTQENDLCDAALYLWRFSAHRWEAEAAPDGPAPGTKEWLLKKMQGALDDAIRDRQERQAAEDWLRADEPLSLSEIYGPR